MTLFDPNSHLRIHQLRQEQLARKAERRNHNGLDNITPAPGARLRSAVRALFARFPQRQAPAGPATPTRPARPEPR